MNTIPIPAQKNRLGRGLASLIGENVSMTGANKPLPGHGEQRMLPVDRISPSPFNPRKSFPEAELEELAASIREKGLVQPIVVRPIGANGQHYEIVAGERRWRAAQRASQHLIPAIVRALSDQEALELAIIENVQRSDLNAIEEATGYRDLIDRFGYKQEELSQIIGKSRSHLANTIRLLKLPESVQSMVRSGELSAGHARSLIGREDVETLFLRRMVFPGTEIPHLEELIRASEEAGFEVLDVENLRPHYALTCRAWVERLRNNEDECVRFAGRETYRTWVLYLAGCALQFETGQMDVCQTLLARRSSPYRRLTRDYMYNGASHGVGSQ